MLQKKLKVRLKRLKHPGDPEVEVCSPGSIEQQLDMCEAGSLRGDEILHHHGTRDQLIRDGDPDPLDKLFELYQLDSSETNREGSEETGDEHSAGLQGGETEIAGQLHIKTGFPGELTQQIERIERKDWSEEEELTQGIAKRMNGQRTAEK